MGNTIVIPIKGLRIFWHTQRKGSICCCVDVSKRGEAVSTLGLDLSTHVGM